MADTPITTGQAYPGAGVLAAIYTVPAGKMAMVSSVVASNISGMQTTIRCSIARGGAADTNAQYLYYDLILEGNNTFVFTLGVPLGAGDIIRALSAAGTVAFNVLGIEV